jgi:hypothetical protein
MRSTAVLSVTASAAVTTCCVQPSPDPNRFKIPTSNPSTHSFKPDSLHITRRRPADAGMSPELSPQPPCFLHCCFKCLPSCNCLSNCQCPLYKLLWCACTWEPQADQYPPDLHKVSTACHSIMSRGRCCHSRKCFSTGPDCESQHYRAKVNPTAHKGHGQHTGIGTSEHGSTA